MAINPLQPPVNYLGMIPQLDLAKQFEGFGEALVERQKRTKTEEVKAAYATDLQTVLNNPSMKAFNDFSLKYPQQREVIKDVASRFTTEQQDAEFNTGRDIAVSLENKNPQAALNIVNKAIEARKGSNLSTAVYDQIQQILSNTDDPDRVKKAQAQTNFALTLLNPEKFGKVVDSLAKQKLDPEALKEQQGKATLAVQKAANAVATAPDDIAKAKAQRLLEEAKAKEAQVTADFARAKATLDAQQQAETISKTKADIRKTDADILIAKENNRIAALNAAQAKETNNLKRQELQQKIDDAKEKRDAADREQQALVSNQVADIDNFLNTAQRIKNTPKDIIKSATGPVASRLPTLSSDVSDFEALVEALGSQAFIAQIPKIKGTGSLSEKEGDKLQASLQTLSLKQSPERLIENVDEAVRLLTKVRGNIGLKYGVKEPALDVPAALQVSVQLPNGQTARFPNQAAADAFKKQAGIK